MLDSRTRTERRLRSAAVIEDGAAAEIVWQDGTQARFHAVWLRANALEPTSRDPRNGQRLETLLDFAGDVRLRAADARPDDSVAFGFLPEDRVAAFPAAWLADRIYDRPPAQLPGWTGPGVTRWDATLRLPPAVDFAVVGGDGNALRDWLALVRQFGFARLRGVPCDSGAVCEVARLFGYVRETNYGRWFDVRSTVSPSNLAYTNLGLQAHTDNPYRDPVPTLQLLACLENSVEGGLSRVVDGFAVAARLQQDDAESFRLLSTYCAQFEYAGSAGVKLRARRPVIELAPDGELRGVRFNNRSAAPLTGIPYDIMPAYYAALRKFAVLVDDPAMALEFRLAPGELFMVDNTRVLHARTAFSGSGQRWLQGCYADRDGLLSTLAWLEEETPA